MPSAPSAPSHRGSSPARSSPDRAALVGALLPPSFFAVAVCCFGIALGATPLLAGQLLEHFYERRILALTHMITLGWVSATMLGVLYRYVPALVKRPLPRPGAAAVQLATFCAGVAGLVTSFWVGWWPGATASATLLAASVALVCCNLWPLLWSAPRHGVAEIGILASTGFLLVAATLGALLALNKTVPVLGGGLLSNLGAHAALAALGWVGLTACALSFRFLPAFVLPALDKAEAARRQVIAMGLLVLALATALLARSPLVWPLAAALAVAVLVHAWLLMRVVASHQLPLDWTVWHAVAGAGWCAIAVAGGVGLVGTGAQSAFGARLAAAYAVVGLLGWISNLILGVSYKLFPAFSGAARTTLGRRVIPISTLGVPERLKPPVFVLFNTGVALTAASLVLGWAQGLVPGTAALAAAAVLYAVAMLRTLACVLVEPRRSDPLAVLP